MVTALHKTSVATGKPIVHPNRICTPTPHCYRHAHAVIRRGLRSFQSQQYD
jgi:hypothetical protein